MKRFLKRLLMFALVVFVPAALWVALVLSAKNGALISLFKRLSPSSKKGEPAYVKPTPASPPKPAAETPVREAPEPEHVEEADAAGTDAGAAAAPDAEPEHAQQ